MAPAVERETELFEDWRARSPFYNETHEAIAQMVRRFVVNGSKIFITNGMRALIITSRPCAPGARA